MSDLLSDKDEAPTRSLADRVDDVFISWKSASGLRRLVVALGAYVACLVLFGLLMLSQKANPFGVYNSIIHSAVISGGSIPAVILRAVPLFWPLSRFPFQRAPDSSTSAARDN